MTTILTIVGLLAGSAIVAYAFRLFLTLVLSGETRKAIQTAPLTATFGLFIILVYVIAAVFAPWIAPYGESEIVGDSYAPADAAMWLGGDQLGRDLFSRIIYGARNTVGLSIATTALAFVAGTTLGLLAAIKGGWVDQLLGRLADTIMAIPSLILALLLLSIYETSTLNMILVIGFIYTPLIFRLSRSVAGNIVVMDYIEAAKLRGESSWYLIRKEILPNAMAPLIAEFGLRFCFVFLLVAGLSFLGLGIQPPTADWGSMVRENATLISFGEFTPLIPAAAIALLTVSVNFVVDWMLYRSSGLKV
uniref:Ribose ABC transport system, permease protein RbsC (TC 3.A.1.2.1) n=1 Tax=uncultured Thiotrichaceae bacterium TaxID=298394 RepID=A0A6S6TEZ5_9GAMM|nr:MAG: Ribose ABC transport system, permease protein RbsC (TC 3.A.1.2.1) [uncultured Thiotrichaceae bacterium]